MSEAWKAIGSVGVVKSPINKGAMYAMGILCDPDTKETLHIQMWGNDADPQARARFENYVALIVRAVNVVGEVKQP